MGDLLLYVWVRISACQGHQAVSSMTTQKRIPPNAYQASTRHSPRRGSGAPRRARQLRSARERVRSGGGDQPLRHPIGDVPEALEARSLVLDDVEEGTPVELHVGEVLEQDVDGVHAETLELLAGQGGSMHA